MSWQVQASSAVRGITTRLSFLFASRFADIADAAFSPLALQAVAK